MKKIKVICFAVAILLSMGSTLGKSSRFSCVYAPQYYHNGFYYVSVHGRFGYEYYCEYAPEVCTYYKPNPVIQPNYYLPCRDGEYVSLTLQK
jgi:hypothetical protein